MTERPPQQVQDTEVDVDSVPRLSSRLGTTALVSLCFVILLAASPMATAAVVTTAQVQQTNQLGATSNTVSSGESIQEAVNNGNSR
jgi:hypothetical protein